jgi:hypothetical protein
MTSARCCIGRLGPLRHTLGHGHRDGEGQGHHAARRRVAHGRPRAGSDVQYVDADGNRGEVRVPNSRPSRPSFRLRAVSGRPTSGHRGGRRRDGEGRARTSVRVGPTTDPSDTADQTTWRNRRTRTTPGRRGATRGDPRRATGRHAERARSSAGQHRRIRQRRRPTCGPAPVAPRSAHGIPEKEITTMRTGAGLDRDPGRARHRNAMAQSRRPGGTIRDLQAALPRCSGWRHDLDRAQHRRDEPQRARAGR